jgi:pimeloyl-ACP methyl ester carboxylesterase
MQKTAYLILLFVFPFSFANAQVDSVTGYFKSFDGTKIYYEVRGTGMPVVLVHGFIVNGESWKRTTLFNDLLNGGYKVISLDMRGNGKSDKPHTAAAYENDAEAKDIMGLLDQLGINEYHVVGYSRGSIIVARLLVLDKRIKKAVMGGMGDGFTDPEWPRRKMFAAALSGEPVKELEGMVNYVKQSGLDQEALAYLQKFQPSTLPDVLGKIKKPVLIICGDKDPDNGSPEALAKMIPNSKLVRPSGDHNSTLRAKEFSDEVLRFIE